jgi:protein-S-isoprenylcysteine O-methyltransferase Ste14
MSQHLPKLTQHISYSPIIFMFTLLAGITIHLFLPFEFTTHTLRAIVLGWVMLLAAPAILAWAFYYRKTAYGYDTHTQHDFGCGPYRFSRHPKYVAFMFMFVGMGFILNSVTLFILATALFFIFTLIIIPKEERLLSRVFEDRYSDYQEKTPMWM